MVSFLSRLATIAKWILLCLMICFGVWFFWPEPPPDTQTDTPIQPQNKKAVKYQLKLAPGPSYLPGIPPQGIGKPLVGLQNVLNAFEQLYPDTSVEVVSVPTTAREYLVTQLSSGMAPDILMVNVEDVWVDIQKEWYIPLDEYFDRPNPFISPGEPGSEQWWDQFKYQAISRGKVAPDGKLYCLSFDMVETGVFYNKDIFKKFGFEPPKDWDELLHQLETFKKTGKYTPILIPLPSFADWCQDLFFDQLYANLMPGIDLLQDPKREPYLQGYLDWDEICFLFHKGFFQKTDPRYVQIWPLMHQLRSYAGKDLGADVTRDFVTQKGVMYWTASPTTYRLVSDPDLGFEWGVFYLPPFTKNTSKYATGHPMCVIGGSGTQFEVSNTSINDTDPSLPFGQRIEQSERLKRVIALLQFMCAPKNYEQIVNEYPCFLPNIVGVPVLEPLKPFETILEGTYTTTKWLFTFDLEFSDILTRMLNMYLDNGISLDGFLDWMQRNMESAVAKTEKRKEMDFKKMGQVWEALAPQRALMEDLPSEH